MPRLRNQFKGLSKRGYSPMPVPVWLFLIIIVVLGVGTLILEPRRRKAAAERKALFEQRQRDRGEDVK
jgi:hypothetical protein